MTATALPPEVLTGVEVAVGGHRSEVLLAVRSAFLRYFHEGLGRPVPVAVVPQEVEDLHRGIASNDTEMIERASRSAGLLQQRLGEAYRFYVGIEEGLESLEIEGRLRHFVRTWAVVRGLASEASGGSASIEVPNQVFEDGVADSEGRRTVAGLRRHEALVSALTGSLESRRSAVTQAVFNAVASLFYEAYSGHPRSRS